MRTLTKLGEAMTDRDSGRPGDGASARRPGRRQIEEVEARAARLGITVERVLQEYARIAFARITDIVEWDERIALRPSCDLTEDEVAAIAEIVCSAGDKKPYRIKMHDKKPVLGAIARYLGMFPNKTAAEDEQDGDGEDPHEFLARKLARILKPERVDPDSGGNTQDGGAPVSS